MKTYEDFDFYCDRSVADTLLLLAAQPAPGNLGSFYGTVAYNQFDLQHDLGAANNADDDPRVTGYVLAEGSGSRIYARVQAPESQIFSVGYGTAMLVIICLLLLLVLVGVVRNNEPFFQEPIEILQVPQMLVMLATLIAIPYTGWRYMRKFARKGRRETIQAFTRKFKR